MGESASVMRFGCKVLALCSGFWYFFPEAIYAYYLEAIVSLFETQYVGSSVVPIVAYEFFVEW
jgi:hypothetical protein